LVHDQQGQALEDPGPHRGRPQAPHELDRQQPGPHQRDEELEGIDLWDLEGAQVPGIDGQIHLQMIDHDWWTDDDFFFKHYRVTEPALKPHL
jgi:hypothetical protein